MNKAKRDVVLTSPIKFTVLVLLCCYLSYFTGYDFFSFLEKSFMPNVFSDKYSKALELAIQTGSIAIGFIGTILSILLSMSGTRFIAKIKEDTQHFDTLLELFKLCINFWVVNLVLSIIIILFISYKNSFFFYMWISSLGGTAFVTYKSIKIFYALLSLSNKKIDNLD